MKVSLKDAAIWEYIYFTGHSSYTKKLRTLEAEGYQPVEPPYHLSLVRGNKSRFCAQAGRHGLARIFHYDSRQSGVKAGPCS